MRRALTLVLGLALFALMLPVAARAGNLLPDGSFDATDYLGWAWSVDAQGGASATLAFMNEAACITVVAPGADRTNVMLLQSGWWGGTGYVLMGGADYHGRLTAWTQGTTQPVTLGVSLGLAKAPYTPAWPDVSTILASGTPRLVRFDGTAGGALGTADNPMILKIQIGGGPASGYTVCVDDVDLDQRAYAPTVPTALWINQLGYPSKAPKLALAGVYREFATPRTWRLYRKAGSAWNIVRAGTTAVLATDPHSGEPLHAIDFGDWTDAGEYRIGVVHPDPDGEWFSYTFRIGDDLYGPLVRDAMRFFYFQRCGAPVEAAYAENPRWTRPAGHTSDNNACVYESSKTDPKTLTASDCLTRIDVSGGWYDAGDYGKYVVNGGIALWTLLDVLETAQSRGTTASDPILQQNALNIPEAGSGLPDFADELLRELDFFEKMQRSDGMVFHMVNGPDWSPWGFPNEDPQQRWVYGVGTAATLNFAAVMAKAHRVFARLPGQANRAARYRTSAVAAWEAAKTNPAVFPNVWELAYRDANLADERFWAAAELYLVTFAPEYEAIVAAQDLRQPLWWCSWGDTACLGTHSLAVVADSRNQQSAKARTAVVGAADGLIQNMGSGGFRVPLPVDNYIWGSNGMILSYGLTLARAHQLTGDARYATAAFDVLAYLLGRNALSKSFVSGYGANPLHNPHHRVFSYQHASFSTLHEDDLMPSVPPGFISGGANPKLEDDYMKAAFPTGATHPQLAYRDHIDSFSTNEVAINWNASLVWLASFADAWSRGMGGPVDPTSTVDAGTDASTVDASRVDGSATAGDGSTPGGGGSPGCGCDLGDGGRSSGGLAAVAFGLAHVSLRKRRGRPGGLRALGM